MSKKRPVEDTFSVPPSLNQAASTDDLMALIRTKQEGIHSPEVVPNGTVPNHTVHNQIIPDKTRLNDVVPDTTLKHTTAPWDEANPKVPVGFNFRMDQRLHAKAIWLCANMPAMSQQKLYRMAVEEKIEELLKQYYKG